MKPSRIVLLVCIVLALGIVAFLTAQNSMNTSSSKEIELGKVFHLKKDSHAHYLGVDFALSVETIPLSGNPMRSIEEYPKESYKVSIIPPLDTGIELFFQDARTVRVFNLKDEKYELQFVGIEGEAGNKAIGFVLTKQTPVWVNSYGDFDGYAFTAEILHPDGNRSGSKIKVTYDKNTILDLETTSPDLPLVANKISIPFMDWLAERKTLVGQNDIPGRFDIEGKYESDGSITAVKIYQFSQ